MEACVFEGVVSVNSNVNDFLKVLNRPFEHGSHGP